MKTFTFRYDPSPIKSAMKSIENSINNGTVDIQNDSISCQSVEDMTKLMTKSRFQIFTAIVEKNPNSLTELAKVLGKDLGNVQRDAVVLQSLGLIELSRLPGQRGARIKPHALYGRIIFECEPKKAEKTG